MKKNANYHHGDLRRALIENGIKILETEGIEKISLRQVARKTGVSQTAPYSHFKDKNALMASIAEAGFIHFTKELLRHTKGIDDPHQRLLALARGYIHFATNNPSLFRMIFGPRWEKAAQYPKLQAVAEGAFHMLLDTVAELIDDPADENKLLIATNAAWSMIHGLANLLVDGQVCPERMGNINHTNLTDRVVELLIQGLQS